MPFADPAGQDNRNAYEHKLKHKRQQRRTHRAKPIRIPTLAKSFVPSPHQTPSVPFPVLWHHLFEPPPRRVPFRRKDYHDLNHCKTKQIFTRKRFLSSTISPQQQVRLCSCRKNFAPKITPILISNNFHPERTRNGPESIRNEPGKARNKPERGRKVPERNRKPLDYPHSNRLAPHHKKNAKANGVACKSHSKNEVENPGPSVTDN